LATHTTSANKGTTGAALGALSTFYQRRWLLRYLVQRQVTRKYKKSYLGLVWAIVSPIIWVFFLSLIFSKVVGLRFRVVEGDPTLNFGLYLYCGLLPYQAFTESVNKGLNSITGNSGLVEKVVFPVELLPLTQAITSQIDKFFGLGALLLVLFALEHRWHWTVMVLPVVIVLMLLFTLGMTYLMAVLGTFLPDVGEITKPILRGLFFVTPILWTPDRLPENLRWIETYNPLAYVVEAYRRLILYGQLPGLMSTVYFFLFSAALFIVAFVLFNRLKPKFADYV
jgi:ABC-2 type transport system permease protein